MLWHISAPIFCTPTLANFRMCIHNEIKSFPGQQMYSKNTKGWNHTPVQRMMFTQASSDKYTGPLKCAYAAYTRYQKDRKDLGFFPPFPTLTNVNFLSKQPL